MMLKACVPVVERFNTCTLVANTQYVANTCTWEISLHNNTDLPSTCARFKYVPNTGVHLLQANLTLHFVVVKTCSINFQDMISWLLT